MPKKIKVLQKPQKNKSPFDPNAEGKFFVHYYSIPLQFSSLFDHQFELDQDPNKPKWSTQNIGLRQRIAVKEDTYFKVFEYFPREINSQYFLFNHEKCIPILNGIDNFEEALQCIKNGEANLLAKSLFLSHPLPPFSPDRISIFTPSENNLFVSTNRTVQNSYLLNNEPDLDTLFKYIPMGHTNLSLYRRIFLRTKWENHELKVETNEKNIIAVFNKQGFVKKCESYKIARDFINSFCKQHETENLYASFIITELLENMDWH